MKMKILVLLLAALGIIGLGCVSAEAQVKRPEGYQGESYNATSVSPRHRDEILDFLAHDKTNENEYIVGKYMCEEFAADLWWNAYNEGIEGCIVWVYTGEGFHTQVKFRTTEGDLWVEPSMDFTSSSSWYEVWRTFCGENAFNKCINVLAK